MCNLPHHFSANVCTCWSRITPSPEEWKKLVLPELMCYTQEKLRKAEVRKTCSRVNTKATQQAHLMSNLSFCESIPVWGTQLNLTLLDRAPQKLQSNVFQNVFIEHIKYLYRCSYKFFFFAGFHWTDKSWGQICNYYEQEYFIQLNLMDLQLKLFYWPYNLFH